MNVVLAAWIASMLVCSLYTFVLPTVDAMNARRKTTGNRRLTAPGGTIRANAGHPTA